MSAEYFYGAGRKDAPKRSGKPSRTDPRGRPATGRIAKILVGQDHGFIRLRDDREIFFHRGDVRSCLHGHSTLLRASSRHLWPKLFIGRPLTWDMVWPCARPT